MKRIKRDSQNGILGGVCEGLGNYFDIDPIIFRLIFIALFLLPSPGGILTYVLAWIIIPDKN
ncbi:MAG: PspC domain-containing protein [Bacteroidota bacterium]|jgi:phage shock protein C|nr:PspC domain-containing protein [Bacteroidota bacterium]|tara:strand:+ start:535 stop:720 length:186 start_codon:yes stop_codon:yes gene_type:complete